MAVDGRWEEAVGLQRALWDLNRVFAKYNLAACIKNRARIAGIPRGKPSLSGGTPGPGRQRGNQTYPEKGKGLIALKGNDQPADQLPHWTPLRNRSFGSVQTSDALKGDSIVEPDTLVRERVHTYYWRNDINCAITTLKILSERFGIELSAQVIDSALGMHGAGEYGAQCGLVEGVLMFKGGCCCGLHILRN
jgi:hypothetical protein